MSKKQCSGRVATGPGSVGCVAAGLEECHRGVTPEADGGARLEERSRNCLMEKAVPNVRAQRRWTHSSTSTGEGWQS